MKFLHLLSLFTTSTFAQYHTFTYKDVTYGVFTASPSEVQFHWKDNSGNAYSHLTALESELKKNRIIKMLTNGGIYSKNYQPAGLWIENGQELHELNTRSGGGNFHIQPNGVFFIDNEEAHVITTEHYQKVNLKPKFAMQSGPMLIIDGVINRRFKEKVFSPYTRSAVCVEKSGALHFFLTIKTESHYPNFYDTSAALLMFGCYNALYLDGSISSWLIPDIAGGFHWKPFVGMISVSVER